MSLSSDYAIENHGSIVLVRPLNEGCERWLEDNTQGTWFGGALAVEPRYVNALCEGLESEGYFPWAQGDPTNDGLGPNITPRDYHGNLVH